MATPSIPPLRYQKGTNGSSPNKGPMAVNRPLSELSPMAIRRNSPSFPQGKANQFKSDSSPASSSPFSNVGVNSPHLFWQRRDPVSPSRENENPQESTSPVKRSSIENLKKASRVKNSTMFAREQQNYYDPARPSILDGRPLSILAQDTSFSGRGSDSLRSSNSFAPPSRTVPTEQRLPAELAQADVSSIAPLSPSKLNVSPVKSSLSKKTGANMRYSGFDPDSGIWEDEDEQEKKLPEGRRLHRHAKSVTFDQAPPQVNEYEMTTPDPSSVASGSREGSYDSFGDDDEGEYSFERGSSMDPDDSFDASLEDTDKTPVVLPEDWRFMSPSTANTDLVKPEEDVFDDRVGSPAPSAEPGKAGYRLHQTSVNSVDSSGQPRPLPPLPSAVGDSASRHRSQDSLSGTIERMSGSQRALPSPPPAATLTKSDLRRMSRDSLSIEDRLKLMMINEEQKQVEIDQQRERRMRRADSRDLSATRHESSNEKSSDALHIASVDDLAPRLDRLSILEQLRGTRGEDHSDEDARSSSSLYDPDVPIPSREDPTQHISEYDDVYIKEEESDDNGLYAIPDMYAQPSDIESETESMYSEHQSTNVTTAQHADDIAASTTETPRARSPVHPSTQSQSTHERMSLPEFTEFGDSSSFDLGFEQYITPPKGLEEKPLPVTPRDPTELPDLAAIRQSIQRPFTPEEQLEPPKLSFSGDESSAEPGTPNSVIHHPVSTSPDLEIVEDDKLSQAFSFETKDPNPEKLQLRSVSGTTQPDDDDTNNAEQVEQASEHAPQDKRVSSLVRLEIPRDNADDGLGLLSLERDFDRVVEAQKRGYLMRQNTKVVVASERSTADEHAQPATSLEVPGVPAGPNEVRPSSRKASQPTWVAEPWNGKSRRRSIRVGGEKATAHRKPVDGPAPPLPGHASNVQENLGAVAEDELAEEEAEDFEDGVERGRLFVKVVGVKDLQLPISQNERSQFALTLDNGLHCVTTAWLDLARDAPIGQEFELVVLNDLEFQLTLQMKLEEPQVERPASPSKPAASPKKPGAFGRLFGSPKKKKESDHRPLQDVQPRVKPPSAYEMVQGLVAKDGSFARAYVSLQEHEKQVYGRPAYVDIKCFNEWALEEVMVGSSRSKKGVTQLQQRPPYEIGKLELQLLYVPKPKGAKDEDMPKSMNGAVRALRDAEEKMRQQATIKEFEGFLSQQGGDCPYWRRRFFKLVGSKFTAYHESTRQPRATINLSKASKLIDDKSSLMQKETSTKGGGRRKSGFADDEEGYMFVEEGFRIRFGNGEVIDFYADSAAQKDEWMQALSQVVGKNISGSSTSPKGWTELILRREKSMKAKSQLDASFKKAIKDGRSHEAAAAHTGHRASGIPVLTPASPQRPQHSRTESFDNKPNAARSQANSPVKSRVTPAERRTKARSMAF